MGCTQWGRDRKGCSPGQAAKPAQVNISAFSRIFLELELGLHVHPSTAQIKSASQNIIKVHIHMREEKREFGRKGKE